MRGPRRLHSGILFLIGLGAATVHDSDSDTSGNFEAEVEDVQHHIRRHDGPPIHDGHDENSIVMSVGSSMEQRHHADFSAHHFMLDPIVPGDYSYAQTDADDVGMGGYDLQSVDVNGHGHSYHIDNLDFGHDDHTHDHDHADLFESCLLLCYQDVAVKYGVEFADELKNDGFVFEECPEEEDELEEEDASTTTERRKLGVTNEAHRQWNIPPLRQSDGKLRIPYAIDPGANFPPQTLDTIQLALSTLEDSSGVLSFSSRTSSESQYIYFRYNSNIGCAANIGRGNPTSVYLGWCRYEQHLSSIIHEILHALGFWHEQSRPDRDDHVQILYDNIVDGREHNFGKMTTINSLGSPYDYGSIMHYPSGAFSDGTGPTIVPLRTLEPHEIMGQRVRMSANDVRQLRLLYQCSTGSRGFASVTVDTLCSTECKCWEYALGECSSDDECMGDLECGTSPSELPVPLEYSDQLPLYEGSRPSCSTHCHASCCNQYPNILLCPQTCGTTPEMGQVPAKMCQRSEMIERSAPTTMEPSKEPTKEPTQGPTEMPSKPPSVSPTTSSPSSSPTELPTSQPTTGPSRAPSVSPSRSPSASPSTLGPTSTPTASPVGPPTTSPLKAPTASPTTESPTSVPTKAPTNEPTISPSKEPSTAPTTLSPSSSPTEPPTDQPTAPPSKAPSASPMTLHPTSPPTTPSPTSSPSKEPTAQPTTARPTNEPTEKPTNKPTQPAEWYPDQSGSNKCKNDGNAPSWITVRYTTQALCCSTHFGWARSLCMGSNREVSYKWWVDWSIGKCVQDCERGQGSSCKGAPPGSWVKMHDSVNQCCSEHMSYKSVSDCKYVG